jgi:2-hydroxycyclohexanecarboxyl-CoA dehydrogenase
MEWLFIGSVAGQIGSRTDPTDAPKAAGSNFAQCLAKDLAPRNIHVKTVNPCMVRTAQPGLPLATRRSLKTFQTR